MLRVTILTIVACVLVGGAFAETPDEVVSSGNEAANEGRMPSRDELLGMLDSMTGLSDEEKENLRQELLGAGGTQQELPTGDEQPHQFLMLFGFLGLVALIFVFFGYKLYKSLTERERRKTEKKRTKESKRKNK